MIGGSRDNLGKENQIQIFIGRQSPLTKSAELATIVGSYAMGDNQVILVAIGPKRMDYARAARIFKGLRALTNDI